MCIYDEKSEKTVDVDVKTTGSGEKQTTEVKENISNNLTVSKSKVVADSGVGGDVNAYTMSDVTVKGDVGGDVNASSNSKVKVDGDVNGDATAKSMSTVTVEKNVKGDVHSESASTVTVKGDANGDVYANNAVVIVKGDAKNGVEADGYSAVVTVEGDAEGVEAENGSTVTVKGNAKAGIVANNSTVTVGGKLTDAEAIVLEGDTAQVIVKGNVAGSSGHGIQIDVLNANGDATAELAIGGTLENGKDGATLVVPTDGTLPEIVVGTIEDINNLNVVTEGKKEVSEEVKQEVISNIKYIIDKDDLQSGILTITKFGGGVVDKDKSGNYDVATAGQTIKVKVTVADGYQLTGFNAGKAKFVCEDDGTYTVIVPDGGGVSLSAVLEAIKKAEDTKTPETTTTTTTVTRTSSGGGSGSGSSSGFHAINVTPGMGRTNLQNTPGSWQKNADNTWSYVGTDGTAYKSDWIVFNNRWYYADANGKITTGWVEINGVWYYFTVSGSSENPEGSMLAGTTTPDGYKLDGNGAWVK